MLARGAPGRALGYFETTLKQGWGAGVRIITAQNFLAASGYPHKCQTSYCALWGTFWARIRRVLLRSGPVREGTFSRRMVPKEYFWLATGPVVLDETVPPECHGRERLRKCAQDTSTEDERAKMLPCVAPDLHARHLRPLARIFLPSYVYNLAKAFSYVYNLAKISSYVY